MPQKHLLFMASFYARIKAAFIAAKKTFFAPLNVKRGEQSINPQNLFVGIGDSVPPAAQVKAVVTATSATERNDYAVAEKEKLSEKESKSLSWSETAYIHIRKYYETRYNVLDHRAEIRERGSNGKFRPLDDLTRNTIVLELHKRKCFLWNPDVDRVLTSLFIKQYHPFKAYFDHLPAWDGVPRVDELAKRVSSDCLWVNTFHHWMRALAELWSGRADGRTTSGGNQMVPLLVSARQGLRKSTFCRMLMPDELRGYYTDKFELAGTTNLDVALARFGLINLDEFDRYSERQMAKLKNLIQLGAMAGRRPYASAYSQMDRLASFIGTSNRVDLLSDPTGSRRFFCQEVTEKIDCDTPVDHAQIYAELLHELQEGARTYFTKKEENQIQRHNRQYYRADTLRELFLQLFVPGNAMGSETASSATEADETENEIGSTNGESAAAVSQPEWMGAARIYMELCKTFGSTASRESVVKLGKQLTLLEVPCRHTRNGNYYWVARKYA